MADTALPTLPQTVDVDGTAAPIESDPLEFMRAKARENIEAMDKNPALNEQEKTEYKKYVLEILDGNIKKFTKIDADAAVKKAEEETQKAQESAASAKNGEPPKEEDPFADIFKEEKPDESMQEKQKIAGEFAQDIKNHRETYLKSCLKAHESTAKQKDDQQLDSILDKLHQI